MTLAELNWHFELRDKLAKAQETLTVLRQRAACILCFSQICFVNSVISKSILFHATFL